MKVEPVLKALSCPKMVLSFVCLTPFQFQLKLFLRVGGGGLLGPMEIKLTSSLV